MVTILGGVLAQEGEQNGFYRSLQKKVASAAPFLTGGSPSFAFSAIQGFIVPNSCPQPLSSINLTTFGALNLVTPTPKAENSTLEFSVAAATAAGGATNITNSANSLVYLSGANLPVTVPICVKGTVAGLTHFTAEFPFESGFAKGLTIAAVVKGTGKQFQTNDDVAAATVFGPGLIEVD